MPDNALLERALTAADPARTPRDAEPDARAIATRDRILRSSREPQRRRARRVGWAAGLTAVAASAALAFGVLLPQGAAVAGTPTPLAFDGSASLAETVAAADTDLGVFHEPETPERSVRAASWSFSVDVDAGRAEIVPQLSTFQWSDDLSGEAIAINGVAYDPGDAVANQEAEVVSTGEVASRVTYAPGEFVTPVVAVPGETPADVRSLLEAFGLPREPSAFDVVTAVTSVFGQWTLTNAQHAELLALIEDSGGAQALGATTDRLGRPVAGIRVIAADGAVSDDVLVSLDSGRIVGVERTVLVDDGIVAPGSITDYRMWDLDEEMIE
ncbi:hypothetical protein [Microbacterium sp. K35]|uniref:hypothetical protein n=1 Tax=Microbacterium sp. K35 TaxID=2305440 RepID=UPI00109B7FC9|nr:hypothetical protein [Microbacterium sp. K35]